MTPSVTTLVSHQGWCGQMLGFGHWGRPVLAFPAESGTAWDFADHGMVEALDPLLSAGRIKLYCVDSADAQTWSDRSLSLDERARRHQDYERWVLHHVVPTIHAESGGLAPVIAMGTSMGAFHAATVALRHAHVFPTALCLSGTYDPSAWHAWGDRGNASYLVNPIDFVPGLEGDHLEWLRRSVHLTLVVGEGAFEVDPTGALPSTRALAARLAAKGIPHTLDIWGPDTPHDWPSWQRQAVHHVSQLC